MALTLLFHPLSSYCHKVLVALYEKQIAFTPRLVNLGDPRERAELEAQWPVGKFPVLLDDEGRGAVPESSIIIRYLDERFPDTVPMIPREADAALSAALQDRFLDLHVHDHMQKIMGDRLRPAESRDPFGVEFARGRLALGYRMLEAHFARHEYAGGDTFSIADCAAAPALFYGGMAVPFEADHPRLAGYFARLRQRPSYARVLREAEPYLHLVPR